MSAVTQVRKNLFETCCRLCLGNSNDRTLIDVFSVNSLNKIIRDIYNINVTPIDKCTTRICTQCLADSLEFNRRNNTYLQEKSRVLKNYALLSCKSVKKHGTPSTSKSTGCVDIPTTVKDISPIADHACNMQESPATSKSLAQYDKNGNSRNDIVRTDHSNSSSKTKKPTSELPGSKQSSKQGIQKPTQTSKNLVTTERAPKMPCSALGNQTALIVATEQADFGKKANSQANRKRQSNNGSDESESRTKVAKAGKNMVARSGSNTILRASDDANASPISNRESNHEHKKDPKSTDKLKPPGKTATPDPRNVECNASVPVKNATSKTDLSKKMRIAPNIPKDTVSKEMDINGSSCSSVSGGLADKNCREKESLVPNKHRVNSKVLQTKGKEDQSQKPLHTTIRMQTTGYRIPRVSIPLKRLTDVSKEQIAGSNVGASHKNDLQSMTGLKTVAIAQSMSSAQSENLDSNGNTLVDADTANQNPSSLNDKSSDEASSISVENPPADDQQPSADPGKTTSESIDMQSLDITRAQSEAEQLGNHSSVSSVDKSSDPTVIETINLVTNSPKVGIKQRRHSTYGSIRVCRDLFDAPQKSVEFAAIRNDLMIRKPPPDESFTLLNGASNNPDPLTTGQHRDDTVVSVSPMQFSVPNTSVVRPPPPRRKSVCFGINNQPTLSPKNVSISRDPVRLVAVQQLVDNAISYSVSPVQQVSATRALPSGMNILMPSRVLLSVTTSGPVSQSTEANFSRHSSDQQASTTAGPPLRTYRRQPSTLRAEPNVITAGNVTPSQMSVNTQPNLVRPPHHQVSAAGPSGTHRSVPSRTVVIVSQAVARNITASRRNVTESQMAVNTTTNSARPASNQQVSSVLPQGQNRR